MFIYTDRLVLRPADRADLDDLVLLDADPEVMRFVSGGEPTPRDIIENWILPRAQENMRAGSGGMWSVVDRLYGSFLGWLTLRAPSHSSCAELELSYRMRRDCWGKGVTSEAADALVDMSFRQIEADRIFASTAAANVASRRVMEKIGMRFASVHTSDPENSGSAMADEVEYELFRPEWEHSISQWSRHDDEFRGVSA